MQALLKETYFSIVVSDKPACANGRANRFKIGWVGVRVPPLVKSLGACPCPGSTPGAGIGKIDD